MNKKQKKMLYRVLTALISVVALHCLNIENDILEFGFYLAVYLLIGYDILKKAGKGIKNRRPFDENFLMAVATIGAFSLAIYTGSHDYEEGIAVMLFYQIGELFQSYAVGKSRSNITQLMDIRPDYANIEVDGQLEQVDPDEVEIGSIIVVQPGEKVPIDGTVQEGTASLNTSALTGESLPREVKPGDEIISGCIDMTGLLSIKTTKEFCDSTVSKIMEMVENASNLKSKSEAFITRFAKVYTPFVCYSALTLAVLPTVLQLVIYGVNEWNIWVYRALTFLVISCPCALVVSVPLSFFAGIGGASTEGVLVKGANYLEALADVRTMVFDKTGTLTKGEFSVSGIHHNSMESDRLLELVALLESASSHPISQSIRQAYAQEINRNRVDHIEEIGGHGIVGTVDGRKVAAGNVKLMNRLGIKYEECHSVGTIIHVAIDGEYAGHIVVSDTVKPHSAEALQKLHSIGVSKLVMLTGDTETVANKVAADLGLDDVYSQLLPGDKVTKVEDMLSEKKTNQKLAFVGDGINDAPVLSRADVGIAMGAMGSDAAIEAADVVLMDDDPLKIVKAIKIACKCVRIVKENIFFACGIKLACLVLGVIGVANMWFAIFADVGVMILAVLNAIRALYVKNL